MPYITPEQTPPSSNCRRLFVPNDTHMLAAILGQVLELTEVENWEQTTGITVAETVAFWETIYTQFSQGSFCMIGAIVAILNDNTPGHMLLCNGDNFNRVDYLELYDVLPVELIIDVDTGSVPDLREAFVIGAGVGIAAHDTGGSETHTLTEAEMPAHSHLYDKEIYNVDIETVGVPDPFGVGIPPIPTLTSSKGGGAAHNNVPPYYALKYAVIAK